MTNILKINQWDGLSALASAFGHKPGVPTQAGMRLGLRPWRWGLLAMLSALTTFSPTSLSAAAPTKKRVVSLSPNITETIFQLGRGDWLVGRSSACDYPEAAKPIPVVGGFGVPSIESLLLVEPEMVLTCGMKNLSLGDALKNHGVVFREVPSKSFADYLAMVDELGKLLECPEAAAAERKRVEAILKDFSPRQSRHRPKVFVEIWHKPLTTVGGKSFINEMIEYAGGENIAGNQNADYFNCSNEWVLASSPEIILCPMMRGDANEPISSRPGWRIIPAVKDGKVYSDMNPDLIFRLGPRSTDGIIKLHGIINGVR